MPCLKGGYAIYCKNVRQQFYIKKGIMQRKEWIRVEQGLGKLERGTSYGYRLNLRQAGFTKIMYLCNDVLIITINS